MDDKKLVAFKIKQLDLDVNVSVCDLICVFFG
jgi:hypothetical protein